MKEEQVTAQIRKARSTPQTDERLQAIHEAHAAVLAKQDEIKEAERQLIVVLLNDKVNLSIAMQPQIFLH